MSIQRVTVAITTDGSGNEDVQSADAAGQLIAVALLSGETLDATADITIKDVRTGLTLLTLSNVNGAQLIYPRVPVHDSAGAAISGAYDAPILTGRAQVLVAQGGATKLATLVLLVER